MKRLLLFASVAVVAAAAGAFYFPIVFPPPPSMRPPFVRPTAAPAPPAAESSLPAPTIPPSVILPPVALPTPPPAPLPPDAVADRVQIRKAARELTLFFAGATLKTYGVALGKTPDGPKLLEGDGRTPEGRYSITGRNPQSKYHLALRISYPSAADRARAAKLGKSPGGDIMIHGLPNGQGYIGAAHRQSDWTIGCIAVTDEEIEEIWRVVPDGCVVDIEP